MSKKPLQILIIDDSPADQEICCHLLREHPEYDFAFLCASSGRSGIDLCHSAQPDCVLVDYLLPDLDGIAFLAALDADLATLPFPIIMLTGYGSEMIVAEAMRAGAADYLPKDLLSAKSLGSAVAHAVEKHQLRRAVEEQRRLLWRTNAELRRRNEEICTFYHMLSHELKTPLTAVREFVAIVIDGLAGPINDTQREYLGIAKESCDQMTLGLNDLLDVARLDTGKLHVEPSLTAIDTVVEQAVTMMLPMARSAAIDLSYQVESALPDMMMDARRIIQVLTNLIGNALKFTAAGGQVTVRATQLPPEQDGVLVAVHDTGRGIALELRSRIFERLYQARKKDEVFEGGLGLGLYICREVVKLHRGEIWVESTLGQGSTFFFTLPPYGVSMISDKKTEEVSV
ncbi:ATP-binding response regulator [Candidatus Entotheonella palauensis]|uniref:ATP-binding response regulator n=1 Tax=Candidatus Entotheonella palauensis TaxID=93172 RepID=UPI000B7E34AA|nr:hybrid sensor histidine kinase/response regulator [Candidatus Entotheonella palauensis]